MQPINFIKTASAHKHTQIRCWFLISGILTLSIFMMLMYLEYQQSHQAYALILHKQQLAGQLGIYTAALSQHATLQYQQDISYKKSPAPLLKYLQNALGTTVQLESLSMNADTIEIKLAAANTGAVLNIAQGLGKQSAYSGLEIVSLEPKEDTIIALLQTRKAIT